MYINTCDTCVCGCKNKWEFPCEQYINCAVTCFCLTIFKLLANSKPSGYITADGLMDSCWFWNDQNAPPPTWTGRGCLAMDLKLLNNCDHFCEAVQVKQQIEYNKMNQQAIRDKSAYI